MTPALPELTRRHAEQVLGAFCEARVPLHVRSEVRLAIDVHGNIVTVVEERAPWKPEYGPEWTRNPIAQFRFDADGQHWTLYWRDRHTRWHLFEEAAPRRDIETLVRVLVDDPIGIFWG